MDIAGAITSILGLLVGVIGFIWTIRGVRKSTTAAKAAETAANETKERLRKFDIVSELSAAVEELRGILRVNRIDSTRQWPVLIERYGYLKERLIGIQQLWSDMPTDDKAIVVGTISHLGTIERMADSFIIAGGPEPSVADVSDVLMHQLDRLVALRESAKQQIGG